MTKERKKDPLALQLAQGKRGMSFFVMAYKSRTAEITNIVQ